MSQSSAHRKIAIVLFNLGGPDRPEAVRPFLFNLFNDPSIIGVPNPLRWFLAQLISRKRVKAAGPIYDLLGGGSPLLPNTEAQAADLQAQLTDVGEVGVFIAMRYWHPMAPDTAAAVKAFDPDRVVLLPLYPQWSTTTTASSLRVWRQAAAGVGLDRPTTLVCCYPTDPGFIRASADLIRAGLKEAEASGKPRVLFSAHGLPKRVVQRGDPYQWQCEQTAAAIVRELAMPDLDWAACDQSRVGPLEWIGPSTDSEIRRAGKDGVPIVVVPLAFVSEHSETLVEIEIEYRHLAHEAGVPYFVRIPAVGVEAPFISGLADLVRRAVAHDGAVLSEAGGRLCPAEFSGCCQARPVAHQQAA